ncbi:MAG: anaerobic ribonucleoside-triphosphate reductase activating protein [Oscillospiraceae bacterium]|jgi:anaerobic ribonucleoside-triphosphate reductase activating protein|nr:anaerobic ribonucleoside-triphosphate reductase activating protein [Oscillospiraceae bacterium]
MSSDLIRISGIAPASVVDGPGYRYTLFTQGCTHHCEGCHNPQTHPIDGGYERDYHEILSEFLADPLLDGMTLSGGEPFLQAEVLAKLAAEVKARGKSVAIYSGYTLEELVEGENPHWKLLLEQCDLLIDGRFILAQKTTEAPFRGSANQRIIRLPESLAQGRVIEWQKPVYCDIPPIKVMR